ncbi:MAG: retroviral-like aspartic protease, partial [Fuerstiella sp.]|nr:retroviral-like aspartic protease [Fuerstiella sp.]
ITDEAEQAKIIGEVRAFYDGGASVNVINRQFAERHAIPILKRRGFRILTGNGNVHCNEYCRLEISIPEDDQHHAVAVNAFVMPSVQIPMDFILGRRTLRQLGFQELIVRIDEQNANTAYEVEGNSDLALVPGPWHDHAPNTDENPRNFVVTTSASSTSNRSVDCIESKTAPEDTSTTNQHFRIPQQSPMRPETNTLDRCARYLPLICSPSAQRTARHQRNVVV